MTPHVDRGPPDVEFSFGNDDSAPRAARQALRPIVGSGPFADDVRLATSELVTNVVMHTGNGGWIQAWGADPLRVEVHDTSPILPASAPRPTHGGRGLRIVGGVTSDWGASATPHGKMVWAEFDRPLG